MLQSFPVLDSLLDVGPHASGYVLRLLLLDQGTDIRLWRLSDAGEDRSIRPA
jgi:hypothetical protein